VAVAGCWALHKIAYLEANRALFATECSAEVVVGLLRRHVENAAVMEAACSALWALVQSRTVQMALPRVEGAGAAVLAALRRHAGSDADTVYAITRLAKVSCLHATPRPLTNKDAAALRRIIATHPTNCGIQLFCDDALTLLH